MEIIAKTERLILRKYEFSDAPFFIELLNSNDFIKFVGNRNVHTIEDAEKYIKDGCFKGYEKNGFGYYIIALQNTLTPLGVCGLMKRDEMENVDLGFALLPQYYNCGYAYEAAKALLHLGFTQFKIKKIDAITLPTHKSSIKLIEKLGLVFEKTILDDLTNDELFLFGLKNNMI